MMINRFRWIALVGVVLFGAVAAGHAQSPTIGNFDGLHLTGLISDSTTPSLGSWVVHGTWTLDVKGGAQHAEFTAALTMERSDLYFVDTPGVDPNDLTKRNAHTHHISVVDGTVTQIPGGLRVMGAAGLTRISGNGSLAPFEPKPPMPLTSTLQIDITGGDLVPYSNVTLTFGGNAVKHFGSNPIAGVVKSVW